MSICPACRKDSSLICDKCAFRHAVRLALEGRLTGSRRNALILKLEKAPAELNEWPIRIEPDIDQFEINFPISNIKRRSERL